MIIKCSKDTRDTEIRFCKVFIERNYYKYNFLLIHFDDVHREEIRNLTKRHSHISLSLMSKTLSDKWNAICRYIIYTTHFEEKGSTWHK